MQLLADRLLWAMKRKRSLYPDEGKVNKAEVARRAGVSAPSVTLWLNGGGMDSKHARALGVWLHVDAVWLETGKGSPEVDKYQQIIWPFKIEQQRFDDLPPVLQEKIGVFMEGVVIGWEQAAKPGPGRDGNEERRIRDRRDHH